MGWIDNIFINLKERESEIVSDDEIIYYVIEHLEITGEEQDRYKAGFMKRSIMIFFEQLKSKKKLYQIKWSLVAARREIFRQWMQKNITGSKGGGRHK